jgi:hypothetical protein
MNARTECQAVELERNGARLSGDMKRNWDIGLVMRQKLAVFPFDRANEI